MPVGEFAELARRPPRTTDTKDLSASLRSSGRSLGVGSVLDLGAGGMLVELSSDLEVGEIVGFELAGPRFRSVGLAAVAHRGEKAIGLRFDTWEGSVDRSICALVAARLRRGQLGSPDSGEAAIGLPGPDSGGHAGFVRAAEKSRRSASWVGDQAAIWCSVWAMSTRRAVESHPAYGPEYVPETGATSR